MSDAGDAVPFDEEIHIALHAVCRTDEKRGILN